jgi:HTH-type transcriptional regulator, transcriptional repressor of NAD biosynthesis genes
MGKVHQGGQRWRSADFEFIADAQNRWEDNLAREANRILICDTNSLATAIWHERYVGRRSGRVDSRSEGRRYGLYILTDVDIPFVQDGIRDGEHVRRKMHGMFEDELKRRNENYIVVSGSHEARLEQAIIACEKLLLGPGLSFD